MVKSKYNIVSPKTGMQEPWSGIFRTRKAEMKWYNTYGKQFEAEGKKLVRVAIKESKKNINQNENNRE